MCEAGSCPAVATPFTGTLPIDFSVTLSDGDKYLIDGSFTESNTGVLAGGVNHLFQVTYEGNSAGGPSEADTITVQAYYALETTLSNENIFRDVVGAFGPAIAASSSATSCVMGGIEGCVGTLSPPGPFSKASSDFTVDATGGVFVFDPYFTSNFGAGSRVGSYIVWGRTTPIPTPEPASMGLLAVGLGGIIALRGRRLRRSPQLASALTAEITHNFNAPGTPRNAP